MLPAVDVAKSVSRVGGKAQRTVYRAVAGDLKLAYAQFEELESFSRFGARLDDDTRKTMEHGKRIRSCLQQPEFAPVPVSAQITVLLALMAELFDTVPLEKMKDAEDAAQEAAAKIPAEVSARFDTTDKLSDEDRKAIIDNSPPSACPLPAHHRKPKPSPQMRNSDYPTGTHASSREERNPCGYKSMPPTTSRVTRRCPPGPATQ